MNSEHFRKFILAWKKIDFFPTFSMCRPNPGAWRSKSSSSREISKISIRARISKWATWASFCPILLILEYDEAENGNFRKFLKNQDFEHFEHQICSRSDFSTGKFLVHFWAVEHIRPPYDSKSHFSKKTQKLRNWCASYFKISKIRQKLADLA